MSGGHWGGKDRDMNEHVSPTSVPKILELLGEALHVIDYDISGDTSRGKESEGKVYDIINDIGEYVFDMSYYDKSHPRCKCCQSSDMIYEKGLCYMCSEYLEKQL